MNAQTTATEARNASLAEAAELLASITEGMARRADGTATWGDVADLGVLITNLKEAARWAK